ncbi:MAG: MoxR family ATPase [Fimbriimonadaceae bacterium]|nr:MoxR family ATPase [Fimbriimonadaceae bacterium]
MDAEQQAARFRELHQQVCAEIGKVLVGQQAVVDGALCGLLTGGHILLEGVPGLGKTLLVRTLGQVTQLSFSRVQFTPDLMPADIVGTNLLQQDEHGGRRFAFSRGPVFAQILLADEINRATPKTQSALLEAMQEQQVTVGGTAYPLPEPYVVLATQNPIDLEGTYPLPEAQLDRFLLKLQVPFPPAADLAQILDRTTGAVPEPPQAVLDGPTILSLRQTVREAVYVQPAVRDYAIRLIVNSHPELDTPSAQVKEFVRFGASPRGGQALLLAAKVRALLAGRFNVAVDDLRAVAPDALRHRLILNFEGDAAGVSSDQVIDDLLAVTPTPAQVG